MSQFGLLHQKRFYPLFWTQFLGAFNDNFLKNALVILFTFRATSVFGLPATQMVPLASGIFILPYFLFSATSGQIADKYEKSQIIRLIKFIEILIMGLATLGFLTEHFEFLLIVLFLMGLHSTFFGPLKYSILPQHLRASELVGGNALVEAGTFLAILIGTIAGGVLVLRPGGPLTVSIALIAVAIAGWQMSRKIPSAMAVDPSIKIQWNPIPPTLQIFKFVKKTRSVFLSILGISWFWFFGASVLSLFPPYCKEVLHSDESVVTLLLATFSIGIGLGSLLCEKLSRKRLELGLVPLGSIGISIFTADLFLVGTPSFAAHGISNYLTFFREREGLHILLDLVLLSIFSGFFIVPLYTMMQERSELTHRSRIIAGNNILNALFMVTSAIFTLLMMRAGLSIPQMFLVLAALNAVVAAYIYTVLPEFLLRFLVWILANIMYRLRVTGDQKLPHEGAAVLVCNHVSFIDWMIIAAGISRPVRFIMDHHFAKGFIARSLLKRAKVILIAPLNENPAILRQAFVQTAAELRAGEIICIFPEGKITWDGKMNPFKSGIEKILSETPVDVYPLALKGLWGSLFSRHGGRAVFKRPRRFWSRVELVVGDKIAPSDASAALLQERVSGLLANSAKTS